MARLTREQGARRTPALTPAPTPASTPADGPTSADGPQPMETDDEAKELAAALAMSKKDLIHPGTQLEPRGSHHEITLHLVRHNTGGADTTNRRG